MTPEIRDYVQHKPDCSEGNLVLGYPTGEMKGTASCSCGLDEALRRVEALEERVKVVEARSAKQARDYNAALAADQGSAEGWEAARTQPLTDAEARAADQGHPPINTNKGQLNPRPAADQGSEE